MKKELFIETETKRTTIMGTDGTIRANGHVSISFLKENVNLGGLERVLPDNGVDLCYNSHSVATWNNPGGEVEEACVVERRKITTWVDEEEVTYVKLSDIFDILAHCDTSGVFEIYEDTAPFAHEDEFPEEN